jgi:hypothetical protein
MKQDLLFAPRVKHSLKRRNNWKVFVKRPDYKPVLEKQLKARNEFFVACATWKRVDGLWMCVEAAPSLGWMKKMDPASAKLELAKRGCSWEWV